MNGDQVKNDCFSPESMPSGAVGINTRQSSNRKDENSLVVIGHEDDVRDNQDNDLQNDPNGGYYYATPMNDAVYRCKRSKSRIVISSPTGNDENETKYGEQYQFEATEDEEATPMHDAVYRCKQSKSRIVIFSPTVNDENENIYEEQYQFEGTDEEEATPMNDSVYRCKRSSSCIVVTSPTANDENATKNKDQYQFEATDEETSTDDESFEHNNKPSHMRSTIDANDDNFVDDKGPVTTKYVGIASVLTVAICILVSILIYLVSW